ncbi:MAG TPA: methyltransferase domain-containing protein [Alphaproteobacteria bacterium]|nr:methyltransferase domain-containing protein [Alphaproteobacteria bacterium]
MPKRIASLLAALRNPPPVSALYGQYVQICQLQILDAVSGFYKAREDDPAPLYGKTVLDLGCGVSPMSQFVALAGADVTAIDPNPALLAHARAAAEAFGTPINFVETRAEDLIHSPQKYDVVLALDVLEEHPDPAKLLWVCRQLLKPDGLLLVSAISRTPWAWVLHVLLSSYIYGRVPAEKRGWNSLFRPEQLKKMAEAQGFFSRKVRWLRFKIRPAGWQSAPHGTRYLMSLTLRP